MLFQFIIKILFRKDVESMAVIYATLIIKGKKTFADVYISIFAITMSIWTSWKATTGPMTTKKKQRPGEADVSKFLKQLHAQVLEKMLEGEMDDHLGYEKNSMAGNNTGNSRNGSYPKKIHTGHGESVISIPCDRNGQFEPIAVPKHESRGFL